MRPAWPAAVTQMRDDPQGHAVILTGAGGAFCSSGDISGMLDSAANSLSEQYANYGNNETGEHRPVIAANRHRLGSAGGISVQVLLQFGHRPEYRI